MNFVAFDFETANHQRHSACSVAFVIVKNSQIVGEYYTLIKPDTPFHWRNIQIHGITPEMVEEAPTFPEAWAQMEQYFYPNGLIVAHNAAFDLGILKGCLDFYQLPLPQFLSLCTVRTSRKLWPHMANHKLNTLSSYLDIPLEQHHHALDDSLACAKILLEQEKEFGPQSLKPFVKSFPS